MRLIRSAVFLAVLCGGIGATSAQSFFSLPRPEGGKQAECNKEYKQNLDLQVAAIEKLRTSAPEMVGHVCTLIEQGSAWLGGELSDSTRQRLKGILGFDIDLRLIKTQCRVGQGNLDRELMTELGFLKSEQMRCKDTTI